jgi:hypothetical protein
MRTYLADALRGLTAAAVLLSAVVHLDLYEEGFRDLATIGPLFMLNFVGGVVIGTAIVVWRHWLPVFLGVGFGALTVAAYWVSVVHGLFGVKEVTGGWSEILASVAEYVAVVLGLGATALLWERPALRRLRRRAT